MKGFIVYSGCITNENEDYIKLFGKLENGQSFASINKHSPYFYVKNKDKNKISSNKIKEIQETNLKNFQGDKVAKIAFYNKTDLNNVFKEYSKEIPIYEADIKPQNQFLQERNILNSIEISGDYVSSERVDRFYQNPELKVSNYIPTLKIISIDTESDKNSGKLF